MWHTILSILLNNHFMMGRNLFIDIPVDDNKRSVFCS